LEECGPCPVFASFALAFALQLKKKQEKPSVRVRKTSVRVKKLRVVKPQSFKKKNKQEQGMKKGDEGRQERRRRKARNKTENE
jgi:hypothetical protein